MRGVRRDHPRRRPGAATASAGAVACLVAASVLTAGVALAVTAGHRTPAHPRAAARATAAKAAPRSAGLTTADPSHPATPSRAGDRARPAAGARLPSAAGPHVSTTPHDAATRRSSPVVEPDVLADSPTRIGPGAIRALRRRLPGAEVLAAAAGRLDVAGHRVHLVGADPQAFSRFTPAVTARSRALWARVAAGDLAVTFPLGHALHVPLGGEAAVVPAGSGATTPAGAADPQSMTGLLAAAAGAAPPTLPVRLGALAAFGLPGVDGVVSPATAHRLGLAPDRLVLVSAPGHDATSVADIVRTVLGRAAHVDVLHTEQPASGTAGLTWSGTWRDLYRQAATSCPGLPWQVLAAIGTIESGNGADTSTSSAGAMGPMQFLPSTWASYGVDADHNGRADIMNPVDAVYSAARYLCDNGAAGGGQALAGAVYAYNHADWYVRDVLTLAGRIAAGG